MADWYLSYWTSVNVSSRNDFTYLYIYVGIVGALIVSAFARTYAFMMFCNKVGSFIYYVIIKK